MHISASLLAADLGRLDAEVRRAEHAGADSLHFDVMDGHYVPNIALSPAHLSTLRPRTRLPFHVHLELSNPDVVLQWPQSWNADVIIVCHDTLTQPQHTFASIRAWHARAGLSLNPDEPVAGLLPHLAQIDLLVMLAVFPGFGGQAMRSNTLSRLASARDLLDRAGSHIPLAVDGGVTPENVPALIQAGADMLIMGTALFQARRMGARVAQLRAFAPG